jgi:hypothetical protein
LGNPVSRQHKRFLTSSTPSFGGILAHRQIQLCCSLGVYHIAPYSPVCWAALPRTIKTNQVSERPLLLGGALPSIYWVNSVCRWFSGSRIEGAFVMYSKKNLMFFSFFFPVAFIVGLLMSLAFSLQFDENVQIHWLIALIIALLLDLFMTWRNSRDTKSEKGSA